MAEKVIVFLVYLVFLDKIVFLEELGGPAVSALIAEAMQLS
jgi:hypothetical protein